MEFRLLGPVEVQAGDRLLGIGHARQRAVLAVLMLAAGRLVSADRLIDGVWGDEPPATARNTLSAYLARLRSVLAAADGEGEVLTRRAGGYVLAVDPGQVDLYRFRRLAADAASALDVRQSASMLGEAVRLWRGPAMAGLDSRWLSAMRDTLELERHAALLDLNEARLRLGEHAGLASELVGQAAVAPADERLIGQLMLAMYRCGRQAEALRWFAQTRSYLVGELGTEPGPELRALHESILRAEPGLALPPVPVGALGEASGERVARPGEREGPVPRELPADVAAFTGRGAELAALDELLLGSDGAGEPATAAVILAVSGTAGVGKTALAVHWAHRAVAHFPDGQLHVNLRGYDPAQPATAADALAGFLRALGVPGPDIPPEEDERAARYRSLLAGKHVLIVLDNASTLEQVRPLLPGSPSCAVVVTSRDSLAGLVIRDGARRLDLDLLPMPDAVTLLRELIGPQADDEPDAVAELAQQCARLPLALRIAAEQASARSTAPLADLVAELADQQQRLDLLSAGDDLRTAVRAVFSWSYDHLDAASACGFRLASLHPGADFEPYAVAALTDSTLEQARRVLAALARAHLLQPAAPGRYGMHDLLRAYARDLAAETDSEAESRAALTRLFDYYLATAAAAADTMYPAERDRRPDIAPSPVPGPPVTDPPSARAWLDGERANLASFAAHSAGNGWPGYASQLSAVLFRYLHAGGHASDAAFIHTTARQAARQTGDLAAEAAALTAMGSASRKQGRYEQAADQHRQALALFRRAGDRLGQAHVLENLGAVEWEQGACSQATRHFRQALARYREQGHLGGQAGNLNSLAILATDQGRYQQAADSYQQALDLYRRTGNRSAEAVVLNNIGDCERLLGRYQQAAGHHRQALALARELGDRETEAGALHNLGLVDHRIGRYGEAAEQLRQALAIYCQNGWSAAEAEGRVDLGAVLLADGQSDEAAREYAEGLAQASQISNKRLEAGAGDGLGICCFARGDVERARAHWEQALALFTELGMPEADEVRSRLDGVAGSA